MKIAVIFQSKSGNVRRLAEEIFDSIPGTDKELCDIDMDSNIPNADFYFIGFGIHNNSCGMDIAEMLEQLSDCAYALFMSCGFLPTDKYKDKILYNLDVWLPENGTLIDTFLCQGKMEKHEQEIMIGKMPHSEEQLREMFREGAEHPNEDDFDRVRNFAEGVLAEVL